MAANQANSAELAAKIAVTKAEKDVKYKNLGEGAKAGNQKKDRAALWGNTIAAAFEGLKVGAAGGAVAGSFVGPIGTAIGAIAGGLAGAIGAGIGGHAATRAAQKEGQAKEQEYTEAIAQAMARGDIENPTDATALSEWITTNLGVAADKAKEMAEELS
jgi:hypothetical protein